MERRQAVKAELVHWKEQELGSSWGGLTCVVAFFVYSPLLLALPVIFVATVSQIKALQLQPHILS